MKMKVRKLFLLEKGRLISTTESIIRMDFLYFCFFDINRGEREPTTFLVLLALTEYFLWVEKNIKFCFFTELAKYYLSWK